MSNPIFSTKCVRDGHPNDEEMFEPHLPQRLMAIAPNVCIKKGTSPAGKPTSPNTISGVLARHVARAAAVLMSVFTCTRAMFNCASSLDAGP